jgi:hypothetical protein
MTSATRMGVGSRLFLTAAPGLDVARVLSPGHWLRYLESLPLPRHSSDGAVAWDPEAAHVLLELACEAVRLREFPHAPSRLDCLFLWEEERDARAWHFRKHRLHGSNAGLYEVEVVACQRALAVDHNLVSYFAGETIGALLEQARRYWNGDRTGPPEILLEGSVAIRRNLLALRSEALQAVKNALIDEAMHSSVQWVAPGLLSWSLTPYRAGRYHLEGAVVAAASLPMSIAGWLGLELETDAVPVLARRGTPPLLVRAGGTCGVDQHFSDLPPLPDGTRYRPVLLCDRSAAHYWQLPTYWEGQLNGTWLILEKKGQC